jgi:type I restriction enzyme M protein
MPQPTPGARQVMLGELIDLVSGVAMGEQGDKAKDILGCVYEYFLLHYVRNGTVE